MGKLWSLPIITCTLNTLTFKNEEKLKFSKAWDIFGLKTWQQHQREKKKSEIRGDHFLYKNWMPFFSLGSLHWWSRITPLYKSQIARLLGEKRLHWRKTSTRMEWWNNESFLPFNKIEREKDCHRDTIHNKMHINVEKSKIL